jgi:methylmalonyl-CoA mutase N-terminal domain/subunit
MADPKDGKKAAVAKKRWEESTLKESLATLPEAKEEFLTTSSTKVDRLYTPAETPDFDYDKNLGYPGQFPFTRGIHSTMYRGRLWTMRQFAGFGTAEDTNRRYKYLLEHGETGLSVAFDMPTLYGRDTDDPRAMGEFGICGVAVTSLKDMELLFDGIPLGDITTSMTINGPAPVIWAMYIAAAEKRGIPRAKLGGTLQNDILK